MNYELPTSVELDGKKYRIRSDYRAVLDICAALTDPDLDNAGKAEVVITVFYEDKVPARLYREAIEACFRFISLGRDEKPKNAPKLMDWEQDFQFIVAPVNRVIGAEIRALAYLHWWTFIGAYLEIGDCTFAQIVRIRELKAKGKRLDKTDREWYREHRDIVDIKTVYSEAEKDLMKEWGI